MWFKTNADFNRQKFEQPMIPKTYSSKRMTFVDALRGIAALAVVLCHSNGIFFAGSNGSSGVMLWLSRQLIHLTHGVDVFFVISGFVIAHSIGNSKVNTKYVGRFALRRSLRLDPPYWVAIVLAIAVTIFRRHFGHEVPPLPTLPQLLAHLLYLQRILGFENLNGVFWTLCLEVQFYLIFIFLIWSTEKLLSGRVHQPRNIRAWTTAIAFAISLMWVAGIFPVRAIDTVQFAAWFYPQWNKFLIGAIIWYAWMGKLPRHMMWISLALLAIAILFRGATSKLSDSYLTYYAGLWVGLATAVLFAIAATAGGLYTWLRWRPLQFLGGISYSLYLFHAPIMEAVMGLQTRWAPGSRSAALLLVAGVVTVSILGGWIMNLMVERPSIRLASRFKLKGDDLAGGIEGTINPADRPTSSFLEAVPN